ncbi:18005_t:CDS:2, partial [Cetraspora pellucida]
YEPCPRCGDIFATNQKFKYHLTERKHPLVKDPNARKSGESVKQWGSRLRKKVKELEQGFFDESEIEEANLQPSPGPHTQAHCEGRLTKSEEIVTQQTTPLDNIELQLVQKLPMHEEGFLDLDVEVPWPVQFPYNEKHRVIWQNRIQTAKNMFKVDEAEYAFSIWFTEAKEIDLASVILGAENEDEAMQKVYLQCLYRNYSEEEEINKIIKLAVNAYRVSDKGKILNAIDNGEFLIRVKFIRDDSVYGDKSQTKIAFKIIDKYEPICESKKADGKYVGSVQDVAELEKIIKRPITLLDITHGTIFSSKKYRSDKYKEIEMVVHNGHAFPRNHHFPKDRMVEYYKDDTWEAINNALQGSQAIWLMGVEDENQRVSQFVLEDSHAFRTWIKHTDIIKACKELFEDVVNWQFYENIINEEKKLILLKSLKVVDLAEQLFGANHAGSRLANEINEWRPISGKINNVIRQACVEHGHDGCWNAPSYHINNVVCIDIKECYPAIAVNGKLPKNDITGFAQINSFKFASNIHPVISVWYGKHFACRSGDGCVKSKG